MAQYRVILTFTVDPDDEITLLQWIIESLAVRLDGAPVRPMVRVEFVADGTDAA